MGLTGSVILVFLVVHLKTFFVPHRIEGVDSSMAMDVASAFQSPLYALLYVVSMVLLAAHLNHGFQSAFQTLGWNNHKYSGLLKGIGSGFALLVLVGFSSFPVIFHFDICGVASNILQAGN
jgi:succinate dehydrogenase / fumarate reductase cytochrome b subunit